MVDAGGVVIWLGSAREDLVRGTVDTNPAYLLQKEWEYQLSATQTSRVISNGVRGQEVLITATQDDLFKG